MAKIVNQKPAETIYTLELTQKELNTFVRLIGCMASNEYEGLVLSDSMVPIKKERILTYGEVVYTYDELKDKTDYWGDF